MVKITGERAKSAIIVLFLRSFSSGSCDPGASGCLSQDVLFRSEYAHIPCLIKNAIVCTSRGSSLLSLLRRIAPSSLSSCASHQRLKQRLFLSLFLRKTRDDRPHSMHVFRGKYHRVYLSVKLICVLSSITIFYYVDAKHIIGCLWMPFGAQENLRNSRVPFKEQQSTGSFFNYLAMSKECDYHESFSDIMQMDHS